MTPHDTSLEIENRGISVPKSELHLLDFLILIAERKKTIIWATAVVFVLTVLVTLFLPNRYRAIAKVLPPQQQQSLAASLLGQLATLGPVGAIAQSEIGLTNPNDIYVGILKSRTVEDALVRSYSLMSVYRVKRMSDARRQLENATEILLEKEGLISIAFEDRDKKRAADIANGYVEELRRVMQDVAVTEASQRRLFFEKQLEHAKNDLADAEEDLKRTQQRTGLVQLDSQSRAIIESFVSLRAQIAAKEVELQAMRSYATEHNPDLIRAEQQLSGLRWQLALLEKQRGGEGDLQVATGKVPESSLEYVRKLRDVKYYETILDLLAKQYEAARLDEAKNATVIQVLDPAVEPDKKSWPNRTLIVLLTTLLGFIGSVVYVFVHELFHRMRLDPEVHERLEILRKTAHTRG
jgi:tyrosine-protein kinase Etk/Wzc